MKIQSRVKGSARFTWPGDIGRDIIAVNDFILLERSDVQMRLLDK